MINSIHTICYDELAVGYQPAKETKEKAEEIGEPIPIMFIPRKPHPNCLLIYIMAGYLEHPTRQKSILPFILNIHPHLKSNDSSPQNSVIQAIQRYLYLQIYFEF